MGTEIVFPDRHFSSFPIWPFLLLPDSILRIRCGENLQWNCIRNSGLGLRILIWCEPGMLTNATGQPTNNWGPARRFHGVLFAERHNLDSDGSFRCLRLGRNFHELSDERGLHRQQNEPRRDQQTVRRILKSADRDGQVARLLGDSEHQQAVLAPASGLAAKDELQGAARFRLGGAFLFC